MRNADLVYQGKHQKHKDSKPIYYRKKNALLSIFQILLKWLHKELWLKQAAGFGAFLKRCPDQQQTKVCVYIELKVDLLRQQLITQSASWLQNTHGEVSEGEKQWWLRKTKTVECIFPGKQLEPCSFAVSFFPAFTCCISWHVTATCRSLESYETIEKNVFWIKHACTQLSITVCMTRTKPNSHLTAPWC